LAFAVVVEVPHVEHDTMLVDLTNQTRFAVDALGQATPDLDLITLQEIEALSDPHPVFDQTTVKTLEALSFEVGGASTHRLFPFYNDELSRTSRAGHTSPLGALHFSLYETPRKKIKHRERATPFSARLLKRIGRWRLEVAFRNYRGTAIGFEINEPL